MSRYWTGFLLFVRVVLYVSAAANLSGDPKFNILIIGIAMVSIILLKLATCQVYRKQMVDLIDSLCYINLIILCFATYFKLDNEQAKASISTMSVSFTVLLVLVVLSCHVYMECTTGCKLQLLQVVKRREQPTLPQESITCTTISTSVIDKPEQESSPTLMSNCQSFNTLREPLLNESFT